MKFQDYYHSLGVSRSASAEEIQRAYRKLAREFHPDVNKDPSAEKRFKEISEAYEVLKDPEKRAKYDELGANWKQGQEFRPPPGWGGRGARGGGRSGGMGGGPGGMGGMGDGETIDFSEFFESMFGGGRGGFSSGEDFAEALRSGRRGQQRSRQGQSHEAEITVTLADAYHGGTRQVTLTGDDGSRRTYDLKIPVGISEGAVIRLAGQGGPGVMGGPPGDLLLTIHVAPDPRFRFADGSKHDLVTTVNVAPWEAALGAKVTVQTLDGDVTLTVPAGTSSGQKLRIRGRGFPRTRGSGSGEPGDLLVEIRIVVPRSVTEEQRVLYEKLAEVSNFDARRA